MILNRLDYWLLDRVVEHLCPLAWMVASNVGEVFNCEGHGASEDEVARSFARLLAEGLIEAERWCADSDDYEGVCLGSRSEIDDALAELERGPSCNWTMYGLTSVGGSAWEQAALPDWSRFVDDKKDVDDNYILGAASERQADKYLAYLCECWIRIDGEVERTRLRPWEATYWKELPEGFELRFRATAKSEPDHAKLSESEFFAAQPWWYTRPW